MTAPNRVVDRIMRNVVIDGDCFLSKYSPNTADGYARVGWSDDGIRSGGLVHRIVWIANYGPIPDDLTVDHMCKRRKCINLAHLRLLTGPENSADGANGRKTHCPQGHEYSAQNTYVDRRGSRRCRRCGIDAVLARRKNKRSQQQLRKPELIL